MRKATPVLLAALSAVHGSAYAAGLPFNYVITDIETTDLGDLGGLNSEALDINDLGDVVGWSRDSNGKQRATIYLNGQLLALDDASYPFDQAVANGINNNRVVVGEYHFQPIPNSIGFRFGFYYYPGIWMWTLPSNASAPLELIWRMRANAINNSDRIVGSGEARPTPSALIPNTQGVCYKTGLPMVWSSAAVNPSTLFCYPDQVGNVLDGSGFLGFEPKAKDINDSGSIVGTDGGASTYGMFVWKNSQRMAVPRPAFSPSTNAEGKKLYGTANGINNGGWVVGSYGYLPTNPYDPTITAHTRAFVWDGATYLSTSLGLLGGGTWSEANEINDQYMVAGTGDRTTYLGGYRDAAFIWHEDFGMIALPSLGSSGAWLATPNNCRANAINNRRSSDGRVQVVGRCTVNNYFRGVRWDITVAKVTVPMP